MVVLKVVTVLMAVASYASVTNGLCCPSCPSSGQCADGTSCTSHRGMNCCATGPCNTFCCNCGGVCRRPSLLQSMLPLAKIEADNINLNMAIEHFGKFDIDKNGAIDIYELEMKQADTIMPVYVQESSFRRIDVNMDGMITIEEFDEDAGRALWEKIRQGIVNVGTPTPHLIAQTNFCVNCIADGGPRSNCYVKCGTICNTPDYARCSNCVNTTQACPQLCHVYCAPPYDQNQMALDSAQIDEHCDEVEQN